MKTKRIIRRLCLGGVIVLVFVLSSCVNQLLPEPLVRAAVVEEEEPGVARSPWGAPVELIASQGKKGTIVLSWKPVTDALRYYIYESESPLQEFVQCGETAGDTPEFEVKYVPPGATLYFKVAALNKRNEVSGRSAYTAGRSLAQPVIYSIESEQTDAGAVTVYWSMSNMEANTYKEKVRYLVYCYEGSTLAAEIPVGGSFVNDPFVKISGLSGSTEYEFEVAAWLEGEDGDRELSGRITAETARRLRPGAPVDLITVPGKEKETVTLSFKLPEEVEVLETVSGEKKYVSHALYFVISRREAGTNGEFQVLSAYFGSDAARAGGTAHFTYVKGDTVFWTETLLENQRGVRYEYKVQACVDGIDKMITTNDSIALVTGWAMARPVIAINAPAYTGGEDGGDYTHAQLSLNFSHNAQGVAYSYVLKESIRPIPDGDSRNGTADHEYSLSAGEIAAYTAQIDLSQSTTASSRGRGLYAYSVQVFLEGTLVEQVDTVGSVRVFEKNTSDIIVKDFVVKDGYPDKFVLTWTWQKNRKYVIKSSSSASGPWAPAGELAPSDSGDGNIYTWTDTSGITSGTSRYYSICALEGDLEGATYYTPEMKTLGTPALELKANSLSYDTITLTWAPVQKADTYRVLYKYSSDSNYIPSALIPATSLSQSAGNYVYGFKPFGGGALDAAKAGKLMDIKLEALNEARKIADGGGDIKTVSNVISNARLFGPAEIMGTLTATENTFTDRITLTWQEVSDAAGYYVVRQQGPINAELPGGGETLYYVDAGDKSLTGKDVSIVEGVKSDSAVDFAAELGCSGGVYTLTDKALNDNGYADKKDAFGVYAAQQNDIPWGYPYTYYVVPVLSENNRPSIRSDKSCVVGGITYLGTSMAPLAKTGRALGFVVDVKATKGTFSGAGDDDETANIGIKVSWVKPEGIDGAIAYKVFRRAQTYSGDWDTLTSSPLSNLFYEDTYGVSGGPVDGTVYEYAVGIIANGKISEPGENARFIDRSRIAMDNDFPAERKIAGYVLPRPTMVSASRIAQSDADGPYETVKFYAAGVDSSDSERKDRGIHGYAIQVRDQSSGRAWKTIKEIPIDAADPADYTENVHNINGLLNVLRDYRHYYRIRTYVDYGGKIYSPPPPDPGLTGAESGYVKWGARPITATEFAGLTSLAIGTALAGRSYSTAIIGDKDNNVDLTGNKPFFLTIGGTIKVVTTKIPFVGSSIKSYNNTLILSFNATDVPGLVYNGSVTISSLTSDSGSYSVTFNGTTVSVDRKYISKPFTFSGTTGQNCDGFDNWTAANGWQ